MYSTIDYGDTTVSWVKACPSWQNSRPNKSLLQLDPNLQNLEISKRFLTTVQLLVPHSIDVLHKWLKPQLRSSLFQEPSLIFFLLPQDFPCPTQLPLQHQPQHENFCINSMDLPQIISKYYKKVRSLTSTSQGSNVREKNEYIYRETCMNKNLMSIFQGESFFLFFFCICRTIWVKIIINFCTHGIIIEFSCIKSLRTYGIINFVSRNVSR